MKRTISLLLSILMVLSLCPVTAFAADGTEDMPEELDTAVLDIPEVEEDFDEDETEPDSSNDFGKDIIPKMLADGQRMFAYLYKGYWRDVGTLDSFWAANMDAIGMDASEEERLVLNDPGWRIYYEHTFNHPQYIGYDSCIKNSIIGDGCDINGTLEHSVVFSDVVVEKDAVIRDSVVMRGVKIGKGARIEYAIVDEDAVIGEGATVGAEASQERLTVIARDVEVPAQAVVDAGVIAEENVKQEEL